MVVGHFWTVNETLSTRKPSSCFCPCDEKSSLLVTALLTNERKGWIINKGNPFTKTNYWMILRRPSATSNDNISKASVYLIVKVRTTLWLQQTRRLIENCEVNWKYLRECTCTLPQTLCFWRMQPQVLAADFYFAGCCFHLSSFWIYSTVEKD